MAGLNDLISNTAQQTTTMPAWYDTAQQNIANAAGTIFGQAPAPGQTVGQQAVTQMAGANPFETASGTMQKIASGAANPWITDAAGNVTPDTSTALGGLFAAQDQQLRQLMPNIKAAPEAANIGSGQFGSLRGQTAVDKAIADAQANLTAQQMQAALQNQQTGVQAGTAIGNLTQQDINNLLTVGQYQQAAPFTNVANYGKVIGGLTAPTTVSNQTQLSPLNQAGTVLSLLGGTTGAGNLLKTLGSTGSGILGQIGNWLSGSGSTTAPVADTATINNASEYQTSGGWDTSTGSQTMGGADATGSNPP